jgi:15-cis-phytoene synthase
MVALDLVTQTARTLEPDRYLAALYAPEPARSRLLALAAVQGEIGRIPHMVREPLLIDIRLQWWRDALDTLRGDQLTGNPLADSLADGVRSGRLPLGLLQGMIDAIADQRELSGWADPKELRNHCVKLHGAAFALAARALGAEHSSALDTATGAAGHAYGLARMLAASTTAQPAARDAAAARCRTAHAEAAAAFARLDSALLPGFLPLALVSAYVKAGPGTEISPLRRWWTLWRAQLSGRLA